MAQQPKLTRSKTAKGKKGLGAEEHTLPANYHPFLIIIALLSGGVAVATGLVIASVDLPIYALPVLGLTLIMAAFILMTCLKFTRPTKLKFGPSALEVDGPDGQMSFPWGTIDTVQVVGATGSFADNPFKPVEKRIGLAVFLKGGPEGRNEVAQADAIIAAGEIHQGERFVAITTQIAKTIRQRGKPQGRQKTVSRIGGGRQARPKAA